jgi:hypothetical protein
MNPRLFPSSNEKGILNQVAEQLAPRKAVEENAEKSGHPKRVGNAICGFS